MHFHKSTNLLYYFKVILGHRFVNKNLLFSVTTKYKKKIELLTQKLGLSCEYIDNKERKDEFVKRYREVYERKNKFGKMRIYRKRENAFLNIKDVDLLLEAKENFTPQLIEERLNHWIKKIWPELEKQPLAYSFFIDQIEYARNFVFKSHFFIRELFNRSCELSMQI